MGAFTADAGGVLRVRDLPVSQPLTGYRSMAAYRGDDGLGVATRVAAVNNDGTRIYDWHYAPGAGLTSRRQVYAGTDIRSICFAGKALLMHKGTAPWYIDWHPSTAAAAPVQITSGITSIDWPDAATVLDYSLGYAFVSRYHGNATYKASYRWLPPLAGRASPVFVDRGQNESINDRRHQIMRPSTFGKEAIIRNNTKVGLRDGYGGQELRFDLGTRFGIFGSVARNGRLYLVQYGTQTLYVYSQSSTSGSPLATHRLSDLPSTAFGLGCAMYGNRLYVLTNPRDGTNQAAVFVYSVSGNNVTYRHRVNVPLAPYQASGCVATSTHLITSYASNQAVAWPHASFDSHASLGNPSWRCSFFRPQTTFTPSGMTVRDRILYLTWDLAPRAYAFELPASIPLSHSGGGIPALVVLPRRAEFEFEYSLPYDRNGYSHTLAVDGDLFWLAGRNSKMYRIIPPFNISDGPVTGDAPAGAQVMDWLNANTVGILGTSAAKALTYP